MEDHGRQQKTDTFGSAVDCPRQASGLAGEVEAQVQPEQMLIHTAGHLSYGFLGNTGEDGIAQFLG